MKLIFVLILIVGIAAWYFMPSKPQNTSSPYKTTVQTNNTPNSAKSTGKAIWDGKLTYDIYTVGELFDKPHSELSVEEAIIKWTFGPLVSYQTDDWEKYLECLTDRAKQSCMEEYKKNKGIWDKSIEEQIAHNPSCTVIASNENATKAKVIVRKTYQDQSKGFLALTFVSRNNLVKTKRGWIIDSNMFEFKSPIFIKEIGYISNSFLILPDGTISKVTSVDKNTGGAVGKGAHDISDKHITVYDLLK